MSSSELLNHLFLLIFLLLAVIESAVGISCYQCSSSLDFQCTEFLDPQTDLRPRPCNHTYKSSYCLKMTGIAEGELGTMRFCSSHDLGNYCEYLTRPGDQREYRSCVYSCTEDGCNAGNRYAATVCPLLMVFISVLTIFSIM